MSENTPKDSHYARLRRQYRDMKSIQDAKHSNRVTQSATMLRSDRVYLYGLHTVQAAVKNPKRRIFRLLATRNALPRLALNESEIQFPIEIVQPKTIDSLVGSDAVHQGVLIEAAPLKTRDLADLSDTNLIIILDHVTDPHNVGAILRSAVAFGAGALISTARHSPNESGVLAKSASGALEMIDLITVRNLSDAIKTIQITGFKTFGLDSEGEKTLETALTGEKIALVLGAEGKGLRQKTRDTVDVLTRLSIPGKLKSLNVSNAAAIALYSAHLHLCN